jgi:hypothetical protein
MGQVASEVLARAMAGCDEAPIPPFEWKTADLGAPLVDLEDKEAVRAVMDRPA